MSASKTQTSNFRFNVLSDGVKLFDREQLVSVWMYFKLKYVEGAVPGKDDQDNYRYMDCVLDEMSVWENLSMFTREWMYLS